MPMSKWRRSLTSITGSGPQARGLSVTDPAHRRSLMMATQSFDKLMPKERAADIPLPPDCAAEVNLRPITGVPQLDLAAQYATIRDEIEVAMERTIRRGDF